MNYNISTTTTAEIPNQTQDLKLYEYDGEYSEYYYSGKVTFKGISWPKFNFKIDIFYLTH